MTVLAISIFAYPMAKAQTSIEENPVVRDALDSMFENLDKTKVPTGLLLDYAVDMVDLSYYDGTELTDENYVDNILLDDILRSIKSAAVQTLPPTRGGIPDDALSLTWPWITSHSVDMSIAAYKYNYIKTNAIEDGLIERMHANGRYRKLLCLIEACFAGSVAEACTGTPGVLIYTATNPNETSKAENFDPELNVYLSDRFSAAFRQAVGKRGDWTMAELYYELYNHTPGSHVTVYNSDNYGRLYSSSLSEFLE